MIVIYHGRVSLFVIRGRYLSYEGTRGKWQVSLSLMPIYIQTPLPVHALLSYSLLGRPNIYNQTQGSVIITFLYYRSELDKHRTEDRQLPSKKPLFDAYTVDTF